MANSTTVTVEWDTDGLTAAECGLPATVEVPAGIDADDIADYLSDTYGYCVKSFT